MNSFVYFIRPVGQAGPTKIGWSITPQSRLKMLMAWSPFPLEIIATIPGNFSLERRIQAHFAELHSHREWFRTDARLSAFVEAVASGVDISTLINLAGPLPRLRPKRKLNRSEDRRRCLSYAARVRCAYKPFWKPGLGGIYAPHDVDHIIGRWKDMGDQCTTPTPDEIERLEAVIGAPELHGMTYAQRFPSPRAVASEAQSARATS